MILMFYTYISVLLYIDSYVLSDFILLKLDLFWTSLLSIIFQVIHTCSFIKNQGILKSIFKLNFIKIYIFLFDIGTAVHEKSSLLLKTFTI